MRRTLVALDGSGASPRLPSDGAPRIALYSHDTCGLGHLRRNLLMAEVLAAAPLGARVLAIAGAAEAKLFPVSDGVDCLTLPALAKGSDGSYHTRSLGVELAELIRIRSATMRAALKAFRPDVLVVDKVPRGALGELDPLLTELERGGRTRLVLGLRDVLDDPAMVRAEWQEGRYEETIDRYYDAVWIYGDRDVYDLAEQCDLAASVRRKVHYTGYLRRPPRGDVTSHASGGPLILCMVGGGQDGASLAESFASAQLPVGARAIMITGPFMPEESRRRIRELCRNRVELEVREFVSDPDELIAAADRVIAMGGYNTVCEVLSHGKPFLVVPRVTPRKEQLIRAQCLRDLDLLELCHPDLASPGALSEWMAKDPEPPTVDASERVDFGGLDRVRALAARLLAPQSTTPARPPHTYAAATTARRTSFLPD
ncbi:MAG: glycosyltransferase [Myxococcales bacterium]|nr:MAG: glycosyltransferase [Myxococcales bacterium]